MNSSNEIKKYTYTKSQDAIVALKEYILIRNADSNTNYAVLSLYNSMNRLLKELAFTIYEYDGEDNLVQKQRLSESGLEVSPNESFTLPTKIMLNTHTERIEYVPNYCLYDTLEYRDGVYAKIGNGFDYFSNNLVEPKLINNNVNIPNKDKTLKNGYLIKAHDRKIKLGFFLKLTILLFAVASIAFSVLAIYGLAIKQTVLTETHFTYSIDYEIKDEQAEIVKFDGKVANVTIPEKIHKYEITSIRSKSFNKAEIESVTFNSRRLVVGREAFLDCESLKVVSAKETEIYLSGRAFSGCTNLVEVYLPNARRVNGEAFLGSKNLERAILTNATMEKLAFKDVVALKHLEYRALNGGALKELFDDNLRVDLAELKVNEPYISYDYLENIKVDTLRLTNPKVEFDDRINELVRKIVIEKPEEDTK